MKFICPLIAVESMSRSRHFYEKLLEQTVKHDFGENLVFHGDFALHRASHFKTLIDGKKIRFSGNDAELYFEHDDLETVARRLEMSGTIFIHGIQEQPWKQRVMRFYDPDGHIVEIGESMDHVVCRLREQGMPLEDIASTTGMSHEFIEKSLR